MTSTVMAVNKTSQNATTTLWRYTIVHLMMMQDSSVKASVLVWITISGSVLCFDYC